MRPVAWCALLLAWQESHTRTRRFEEPRQFLAGPAGAASRRRLPTTYTGFAAALLRWQAPLSQAVWGKLRETLVAQAGRGYRDAHGYDAHGYDAHGYDAHGYDAHGYDAHGYDAHGYSWSLSLDRDLAACRQDESARRGPKATRRRLRKKTESPPKPPKLRPATAQQRHRAGQLASQVMIV